MSSFSSTEVSPCPIRLGGAVLENIVAWRYQMVEGKTCRIVDGCDLESKDLGC